MMNFVDPHGTSTSTSTTTTTQQVTDVTGYGYLRYDDMGGADYGHGYSVGEGDGGLLEVEMEAVAGTGGGPASGNWFLGPWETGVCVDVEFAVGEKRACVECGGSAAAAAAAAAEGASVAAYMIRSTLPWDAILDVERQVEEATTQAGCAKYSPSGGCGGSGECGNAPANADANENERERESAVEEEASWCGIF